MDAKAPAVIEFTDPGSGKTLRIVITDPPVVEVNTHTDATGARSWSIHDFSKGDVLPSVIAKSIPGLLAAVLEAVGWIRG